ncbi:MAG: DNA polymerase III subunit alpha [Bacteroidaceae bacterium]|nr:DNA polymerase III subunit alpha [Bacteroidaceae bacterium]
MQDFVHLHVHTQYSILDGQASVKRLVDKAIADGMKGIAVTDHGNMMAIKEFYNYVNKMNKGKSDDEKFKPIIGCEVYVAERRLFNRETKEDMRGHHLVLLAKNKQGYHNLIKIVSKGWSEGYYYTPRTDKVELEKYKEGLIVCSACLGGEIPQLIRQGKLQEAEDSVNWFKSIFGEDYYLELQLHKATVERANHEVYEIQLDVNKRIIELSKKCGVKLVCTNDVHFVDEENAEAHDRLICLSTGKDLDDPKRMLYSKQEWMKTKEEMNAIFGDIPESLSNTVEVCDKVEFYSIDNAPIMPNFAIPEEFGTEELYRQKFTHQDLFDEFTRDEKGNVVLSQEEAEKKIKKLGGYEKLYRIKLEGDYLRKLTYDGAKKCYPEPFSQELTDRIDFELHIMKTMGFPGYFLIVQDFIRAAREKLGVAVGPGRGSAAGSVVAYCLEITRVDPIKYDLLFERFLNPDRISLPDIDVDFDDDGRGEVLKWVTEKYGQEKVAHIITYGTMATKLAIKDVARVQKVPLETSNRLCKAIPDRLPDGKKMNLPNAIAAVPELREAEASPDPLLRDTIRFAKMLEGNVRNTGVHACGTIICRDDITDHVPISIAEDKETGEKLLVTQYEGSVIEETGLIKMDFLGLKTLSVINEALENIKQSLGEEVNIDKIPIDDELTYSLYCKGNTIGTFQFESPGMQKYLRELQPSTFEDLIAMNALYRPGPMDYIPDFIQRKHNPELVKYDLPCMEKYLKDTYGITVYQEQVMLLSRLLANFTRGESDTLRKAMGKKLKEKLDELKPKFIKGGQSNGHPAETLEKIWADWEKFASYAFNKSHATCYSWVAYQTAYLKAHYPSQYMAGALSRNLSNITEITKLMQECTAMGIKVLGPDVNESRRKFSVNKHGHIRFGLCAVKGVGENAVQSIIDEREANGPFTTIFDFVERVNLTACNRKNLECLALSGAFDELSGGIEREQYMGTNSKGEQFLEALVKYGNRFQMDKNMSQMSLFGDEEMAEIPHPEVPEGGNWSSLERLNRERELVGIYLSAHPLDEYALVLNEFCNTKAEEFANIDNLKNRKVTFGGIVSEAPRTGQTKRGNPFGIVKIEDFSGTAEFPFFGDDWIQKSSYFVPGTFLYLTGSCQPKRWKPDEMEFAINSIQLLADVKEQIVKSITITFEVMSFTQDVYEYIADYVVQHPGNCKLQFNIKDAENGFSLELVSRKNGITVEQEFIDYIKSLPNIEYKLN